MEYAPRVLSRDVRFEGFSTSDWLRLREVFVQPSARPRERTDPAAQGEQPPVVAPEPPLRRRGGVIAVVTDDRLRKLVSTRVGRLDRGAQPWPEPLQTLAERHGARWAAALEYGALDELMERFAARLLREQDLLSQAILFVNVLRELEAEKRLQVWPWRLSAWPVPRERVVARVLDAFCPDGKSVVFGVFDAGEVFTAIVLRRKGHGFDLVLGPDELRREMGLLSGDWRRDYRHLARAAEESAGPIALGCFGEVETLRQLARDPSPGAWAAAVAARDVVLAPVTPAIAVPLGIDVGRAAFAAVRGIAERMGAGAWFGPDSPLSPALERLRELRLQRDLQSVLGFDPWELVRRLLARDRDE
jgi:hypothetical protein